MKSFIPLFVSIDRYSRFALLARDGRGVSLPFSDRHTLTLRKEKKQRGRGYWYAYKR